MLVSGLILVLIGAVGVIYGIAQRSTGEYMLASAFGSEEAAIIDIAFYLGIAVLFIGAILLIVDYLKKNKK